jgi:predicted flap endonuclease-1-like 5' DNA nuclease
MNFFDLLQNFFYDRTNEETILLGFMALLVFLFGVIVGWIVQGSKTRRYKKQLMLLQQERNDYEMHYRTAEEKQKALARELEMVSREKVEAMERIESLNGALEERDKTINDLLAHLEDLTISNQSFSATIESLNDQVIGLKTQNEQLTADAGQTLGASPTVTPVSDGGSLEAYIAATEARFQSFEERLQRLTQENTALRGDIPVSDGGAGFGGHQPTIGAPMPTDERGEPLVIRADSATPGALKGQKSGETEVIVQTRPSVKMPDLAGEEDVAGKDDLTRIKHIGPFLARKLNEADIYSYEQIANWNAADIATYTELIGYLPGVIEQNDWVGQAAVLAAEKGREEGASYPSGESEDKDPEDLKIIEGIGPKIETVLKDAGIDSLATLAATNADRLRGILDAAGSRYKSHNPESWPEQAALAADGLWEQLEKWQKKMKSGR